MDYEHLLEGCGEVGVRLLSGGAEIYRVEDTIGHILSAYGVQGSAFALPNCLIVSLFTPDGRSCTRMYRTGAAQTDIEVIERFNGLSRSICASLPPPEQLSQLARETAGQCRRYQTWAVIAGYFLGGLFFTPFFGGGALESLCAALAALISGLCVMGLDRLRVNFFFKTIAAALALGLVCCGQCALGLPINTSVTIVGAIMVLVPGLVFTNFMCDLITGDALSGISAFIRALLTAAAIAIGVGAAMSLFQRLGLPAEGTQRLLEYGPLAQCAAAFLACLGFCLLYNVHGGGVVLCCLGGALGWGVCLGAGLVTDNLYFRYLAAAVCIAIYAEAMARVRKYPVTAYLVVSYFPLVPGSYVYYTMFYAIQGEEQLFLETGLMTIGLAACLAMGTLLVSTTVRTCVTWKRQRRMAHG